MNPKDRICNLRWQIRVSFCRPTDVRPNERGRNSNFLLVLHQSIARNLLEDFFRAKHVSVIWILEEQVDVIMVVQLINSVHRSLAET